MKRKLCLFVNYSDIQSHTLFVVCSYACGNSRFLVRWRRLTNFVFSSHPSHKITQICKNVILQVYQRFETPKNPSNVIEMCFVKKITIFLFHYMYQFMYKTILFFRGKLSTSVNVKHSPRRILFYISVHLYVTHTHTHTRARVRACVCVRDEPFKYYGKWKLLGKIAGE